MKEDHEEHDEGGDGSFGSAWAALSGESNRVPVTLDVSVDLSDGRELHEHLAWLTQLLIANNVMVSATSVAAEWPRQASDAGDWITASASVTHAEEGLTGHSEAERGVSPQHPVSDSSVAQLASGGPILKALMLTQDYEHAIGVSAAHSGVVGSDLGLMLIDHLHRALRDLPDRDSQLLLLMPPKLATAVRPLITDAVQGLQVHGYDEIRAGVQIDCVATLRCPIPPYSLPSASSSPPAVETSQNDMGEGADWNW